MDKPCTLVELGERRILREIIPEFVESAGDDCATMELKSKTMVVTTDPVPRPAAEVIGKDGDPFWYGWLLVTINASDIAASGARPEGFLAALDLPRDYPIESFRRILDGIRQSCLANGIRYVGGNLRESTGLSAVGTAFGSSLVPPLSRVGAKPDDLIVVLGKGGQFWADALHVRSGGVVDKRESPLYSPVSQSNIVYLLNEVGIINCSMDTSDGLAPTLEELSILNNLSAEVDLSFIRESSNFKHCTCRPEKLWFGWGDWTVVCAINPVNAEALRLIMEEQRATWSIIGKFSKSPGEYGLYLIDDGRKIKAGRLESERFSADSWFYIGIEEYIRQIESFVLP